MSDTAKTLVQRFYDDIWNQRDEELAAAILHPELVFRRSLLPARHGLAAFLAYLRAIHTAFGAYHCKIDDLIAAETQAAALITFTGRHQGVVLGAAPTGRLLTWSGSAFFQIAQGRITHLQVLADLDAIKAQLGLTPELPFPS